MTRISRTPSLETRQKISQAVTKAYAQKTEAERQKTRELQSAALKRYWSTVPKSNDDVQSNW